MPPSPKNRHGAHADRDRRPHRQIGPRAKCGESISGPSQRRHYCSKTCQRKLPSNPVADRTRNPTVFLSWSTPFPLYLFPFSTLLTPLLLSKTADVTHLWATSTTAIVAHLNSLHSRPRRETGSRFVSGMIHFCLIV
jgi:hypothetical protein